MSDDAEARQKKGEEASNERKSKARTDAKVREREEREQTLTTTEEALTSEERNAVSERLKLSALSVYSVILREGEEELHRPKTSLWWSGVAAGLGISTSVLMVGVIRANLGEDHPYLILFQALGYTFGFVLVILCRLQLFTENTITVVLPVLAKPTAHGFFCIARLWSIVFAANMVGTFVTAGLAVHGNILTPEILRGIIGISHHVAELSVSESLLRGIPSGFFIAALVWMLPSAKGSELLLIIMFTWLIAAGEFTHVVAGSNEIFTLVFTGELGLLTAFSHHILPMLVGNILGGTGLFAMLAYGQVHDEM
ncbi:Formate/nitrite transporter FocA, FNT family [Jannaschia faecimaris]|uniref:Formate/nitrite transporter FocA, FNT family n=1 Tax=Jannaschia faecimaris TaxID=1244108 RepID=A0A1H3LPL8_9RHOB|nr:formate/nitrite transporter family protein [Jannaschia faecimaris]SDY66260.1 Formate/nitrite transporter FocA, FNT family [Jannaschia faecimaris]